MVTSQGKICRLAFAEHPRQHPSSYLPGCPNAIEDDANADQHFKLASFAADKLQRLETAAPNDPIELAGTTFQQSVWNAIRQIPLGETCSYLDLAIRIGREKSVRAVANACGANPIAGLVPCHRVLRSDGSLGGYRWGLAIKKKLLGLEGVLLPERQSRLNFDAIPIPPNC